MHCFRNGPTTVLSQAACTQIVQTAIFFWSIKLASIDARSNIQNAFTDYFVLLLSESCQRRAYPEHFQLASVAKLVSPAGDSHEVHPQGDFGCSATSVPWLHTLNVSGYDTKATLNSLAQLAVSYLK